MKEGAPDHAHEERAEECIEETSAALREHAHLDAISWLIRALHELEPFLPDQTAQETTK